MADFLILDDANARGPSGIELLKAARVISDADFDIASLKSQGVSVIAFNPGTMGPSRETYLRTNASTRAKNRTAASLNALLLAEGAIGGGGGAARDPGDGMILTGNALDVVANADGSMVVNTDDIQVGILATDGQHGDRGGGTQHANAVAAGAAGFLTGADKTKLDGLSVFAPIVVDATTTRTLADSDNDSVILFTNVGAITVTVPDSLSLGFGVALVQDGGGIVQLAAGGTLTFKAPISAASPPETSEDGALIALTMIDVTGGSERALVFGSLA